MKKMIQWLKGNGGRGGKEPSQGLTSRGRHVWIVEDLRPYPYDWEVDGE